MVMNKLPPHTEELLKEFQSGTMFPFSETLNRAGFIIKSEFLPRAYPVATLVVTPMLSMQETGAVFYINLVILNQFNKQLLEADSFLNIASEGDERILRSLTNQDTLDFHFYDQSVEYKGSKRIRWNAKTAGDIRNMMRQAREHNATLHTLDFPVARTALMEQLEDGR
jgi:hypothetical protein